MRIVIQCLESNVQVQSKRPNIHVDGLMVSRTDHKICEEAKQAGPRSGGHADTMRNAPVEEFGEKIMYI